MPNAAETRLRFTTTAAAKAAVQTSPIKRVVTAANTSLNERSARVRIAITMQKQITPPIPISHAMPIISS